MKILLDTNFIIDMVRFKIDLGDMGGLAHGPYTIATLNSVIRELQQISSKRAKSSLYAKAALKLVEAYDIRLLESSIHTDDALLNLAQNKDYTVATNDRDLRKRLKALGKKTIYLKSKKHLAIG